MCQKKCMLEGSLGDKDRSLSLFIRYSTAWGSHRKNSLASGVEYCAQRYKSKWNGFCKAF